LVLNLKRVINLMN